MSSYSFQFRYCRYESFMGSKKRGLSDGSKSRNVEDSKNVREDHDNVNSIPDDVFADYLNSPSCAKIFFNCFENIERQINELYTLYEARKTHRLKTKSNYHL